MMDIGVRANGIFDGEASQEMSSGVCRPRRPEVAPQGVAEGHKAQTLAGLAGGIGLSLVTVVDFTAVIGDGSLVRRHPYVGCFWRRLVSADVLMLFIVALGVRLRW